MSDLFWRLAYKRYNRRKPSKRFEVFAIACGATMAALYVIAVFLNPTVPNGLRLIVAGAIIALGMAHRRVRLERQKGADALYRKAFAAKS